MSHSAELLAFYQGYFTNENEKQWELAAIQAVDHIEILCGRSLERVLDVGAGDGAALQELERRGIATSLEAVEISASGIERIKSRNLKTLSSVKSFDGYKLPYADKEFDLALTLHVLEHVEHERLLLREMARVAKVIYIEVPLEHTFRLNRSIELGKSGGHINHYTFDRFLSVLRTSGLTPTNYRIFPCSLPYERHVGGPIKGTIKHMIRSAALSIAPSIAPQIFVYMAAALCSSSTESYFPGVSSQP
jgi:SAM-dependent methyltransferase